MLAFLAILSGVHAVQAQSAENTTGDTLEKGALIVRSLPWLGNDCADPHLPTLSGPWAIGCKGASTPNRAQHVSKGTQLEFPPLGQEWGHGEGVLVDHTHRQFWRIGSDSREKLHPFSSKIHSPLISDGQRLVISSPSKLEWVDLGDTHRFSVPQADPAPWYAPAISGDRLAWVQRGSPQSGEDVWAFDIQSKNAWPVAQSTEHERHVALQGVYIAWMTDTAIHLLNTESKAHLLFPGQVNSNTFLSLSQGVVCWESFERKDLDIHCSDGLHLDRPGDQRHPRRWKEWLLVHENNMALLVGPLKPKRSAPTRSSTINQTEAP